MINGVAAGWILFSFFSLSLFRERSIPRQAGLCLGARLSDEKFRRHVSAEARSDVHDEAMQMPGHYAKSLGCDAVR